MSWPRKANSLCCAGLKGLLSEAGAKGLAALVKKSGSQFVMVLQARGLAFADEHLVVADPSPRDRMWKVSESCGMQYCPFCGAKIERIVARDPERFEEMATTHYKLLDENPDRPALTGKPVE